MEDLYTWLSLYGALFVCFFIFSSPFTGNREFRTQWGGYPLFSITLFVWLALALAMHTPAFQLALKAPMSLFVPVFTASVLVLAGFELLVKLANHWFVFHVGLWTTSREVIQNAAVISVVTCLVYSQCGDVDTTSGPAYADAEGGGDGAGVLVWAVRWGRRMLQPEPSHNMFVMHAENVCRALQAYNTHMYPPALVMWITGISMCCQNFLLERMATERFVFASPPRAGYVKGLVNPKPAKAPHALRRRSLLPQFFSELDPPASPRAVPVDDDMVAKLKQPSYTLSAKDVSDDKPSMVSWYDMLTFSKLIDLLITLKVFTGRFDMRSMQACGPPADFAGDNDSNHVDVTHTCNNCPTGSSSSGSRGSTNSIRSVGTGTTGGSDKDCGYGCPASDNNNKGSREEQKAPWHRQATTTARWFTQFAHRDELWLDFMADCGDGFNPSYAVTRALAQPMLPVAVPSGRGGKSELKTVSLPRAQLLVLGGDLAYPNPSWDSFERRFFRTFQCAMPPPPHYDKKHLATHKPAIPPAAYTCGGGGASSNNCPPSCKDPPPAEGDCLASYQGPQCFAIPGNHDWFDGLATFIRFICFRNWIGGWLLPQKKSYFALQLPKGWWLFGFDKGLGDDIDPTQFQYFWGVAQAMRECDRVIFVTHEPDWISNVYEQHSSSHNLRYLLRLLGDKVALRLAGDLHHYTRHVPVVLTPDGKLGQPSQWEHNRAEPCVQDLPPSLRRSVRRRRHSEPGLRSHLARAFSSLAMSGLDGDDSISVTSSPSPPESDGDVSSCPPSPPIIRQRSDSLATSTTQDKWAHRTPRKKHRRRRSTTQYSAHGPNLVVAGGGGAFLHPTHLPKLDPIHANGKPFARVCAYPKAHKSRQYSLLNLFFFRRANVLFDLLGSAIYFALVASHLPLCDLSAVVDAPSWFAGVGAALRIIAQLHVDMLLTARLSLVAFVCVLIINIGFTESFKPGWQRVLAGTLMTALHSFLACAVAVVLEGALGWGLRQGIVGQESLSEALLNGFPNLVPLLSYIDPFGLAQGAMKALWALFDLPDTMARLHQAACQDSSLQQLSRAQYWSYYVSKLPYFWLLAAPLASFALGAYLCVSVLYWDCHMTEAFSSLRIESCKNFVRMHVTSDGDLEVFSLGLDKVPRKWVRDSAWSGRRYFNSLRDSALHDPDPKPGTARSPAYSYHWERPSVFAPKPGQPDKVKLVDHFVIRREVVC